MRVPAAVAAIPLLAGCAAGFLLVDVIPERLILACAAAAVFALLAGCGFLAEGLGWAVVAAVVAGCAAAGVSAGASAAHALYAPSLLQWFDAHGDDESDPVVIEGVLREDAAPFESGAALSMAASRLLPLGGASPIRMEGGLRLTVGGRLSATDYLRLRARRRVRVVALLRRPTSFHDPGVPDETRPLARRGVALTGTIKSASLVEILERGSVVDEAAAAIRARVRRVLSAQVGRLSARSAAIAIAILIGDRTGLSDEDERRLRDAGTYHVIAISGGNIAILTAILMGAARMLRIPLRAAAVVAICALLLYGEVAGGAASVSRAVTAAVIFLSALLIDHRGSPLNTVAMAAIVGVAVSPAAVLDAGFLLSFGATTGIVLGMPRLTRSPSRSTGSRHRRVIRAVAAPAWLLLAATICAETAVVPLAAVLFSRVTAAGLLLNFIAVPLMTIVQAGSMALVAAPASSRWTAPIASVVHRAADGIVESSRLVDVAPWLVQDVPPLATHVSAAPAGTLRVVVLDVGQGDATVAVLPDATALLIDTGGLAGTTFDIGGRVVVPALRALGVQRLHALVLTHGDPDHVGGAERVMERLRPLNVWEGVPVPPLPALKSLAARAALQRSVWRTVRPGDIERAGDVEIRILHPPAPDWERQRVRNDDSIVLELRYRDVSILLPGDIGQAVERSLAPSLHLAPIVVLKAPHHGSATSSSDALLDAVRPRAVIFSAGKNNRFGHPAPVVVQRYAKRGVAMFNTADDGAVFVETDGRRVEVRGWVKGFGTFH